MLVGLVGCGIVGTHLGLRLLRAGHTLRVYDADADRAEPLLAAGADWAASPATACEGCALTLTALPGPDELRAVLLGDGGLWAAPTEGLVHVDCSTVGPDAARRMSKKARQRKVRYLDAPISRGALTERGPLLVMWIGGDADLFDEMRRVLETLADRVAWCGRVGDAQVVKLVNNLVTQSLAVSLGEALTLGVRAGLQLETLRAALRQGTAQSRLLDEMLPFSAFRGDWRAGLRLDHAAKDLELATELAREHELKLPLTRRAIKEYRRAIERGWGDLSCHAVLRLAEERAGVELRSLLPDQSGDDDEPLG
jgi:3-hydroxyisobutyrate dehydrogenase